MADVEDEADFGSHFLDSMLEVEMTEEDNELDVSKNCDPLETLPPVPTFDLQSETLSYKDVYKNAIPQPVLATLPLPAAPKVPLVINPNSVLFYSGDASSPKTTTVLAPVQKISPKSNAKNTVVNNTVDQEKITNDKFLEEVFKPEFIKNVFVKAETLSDISQVSEEEMEFYKTCFKDVSNVQKCRLHCTICDKHIGCAKSVEKKVNVHTMLKVLTCKPCFEFYGDGNFPCDKGDNCEIYCRWCGQGGALVCCSFCPRVFCKKCVKRNYGISFLKSIEKASDWACFCCAQKPLWPHRAICRALIEYLSQKKTDAKTSLKDTSSCCRVAGLVRKQLRATLDKGKLPPTQLKPLPPPLKTSDSKNKCYPPAKPSKGHVIINPIIKQKPIEPLKQTTPISTSSSTNRKSSSIASFFSPRSILTGNTIIRGIATSNSPKFISTLSSSQLLQTPVIHGETLITPPSRLLVQSKPPPSPSHPPSYVKVSLTHQTPNVDMKKIPTVKIPHDVQGLVLRLIFPDNKMQYVRLTSDGSGCKASKEFPMPHFPSRGASFVEENLAEAFQVSKAMFDKLMLIREKVNSRTKFTEESVFNSSVKKLRGAYEKTVELFRELDRTLAENYEEWKKLDNATDVIDISDDEGTGGKRTKGSRYTGLREKYRTFNEDSDIEILDDVAVNGKPPNNYKEKYRSRRALEQGKSITTHPGDSGIPVKRKKGRPRKNNKIIVEPKMLENGKVVEEVPNPVQEPEKVPIPVCEPEDVSIPAREPKDVPLPACEPEEVQMPACEPEEAPVQVPKDIPEPLPDAGSNPKVDEGTKSSDDMIGFVSADSEFKSEEVTIGEEQT